MASGNHGWASRSKIQKAFIGQGTYSSKVLNTMSHPTQTPTCIFDDKDE